MWEDSRLDLEAKSSSDVLPCSAMIEVRQTGKAASDSRLRNLFGCDQGRDFQYQTEFTVQWVWMMIKFA